MSDASPVTIPQSGAWPTPGWIAAAGYLAVALALVWPLPLRLATHMPGDPFGDPLLNAWILGWDADRLRHGLRGFWDAPLFYPARDTLAWSEHLLGIALFTAPVYWLSGNLVLTYNAAFLGSIVLAGTGMFLLARELTGRDDAAWVAGLLFACLPYRIAQLSHLQVLVTGWMPLALLGLHRYFQTGSLRALAGCVAAYLLTALSNGYYLFFLSLPVVVVAGWQLARRVRARDRAAATATHLALAALVILVALLPVARAYVRVREAHGFTRTRGEMILYAARPSSYASIAPASRAWRERLPVGQPERELFPGLTLAVLSALGVVAARRRSGVRLYAGVALAAAVLTLGPEPDLGLGRWPTGPYDWLLAVPGMGGLRVPARFATIVYLGMAVVAAFGAAWALARVPPRTRAVLVALASLSAVAEGAPDLEPVRFPAPAMGDERAAYEWLATQPRGPMLELPVGRTREAVRYLTGTLMHGNRIVNGYSGYGWALQSLLGGPPTGEVHNATELLRAARALGLRYLLVHRRLYDDQAFAADLAHALAEDRRHVDTVTYFGATTALVLRPADPRGAPASMEKPLPLTGCGLEASDNTTTAARAVDGDVASRWLTGRAQAGDEWFLLRCPDTRILTGVDLLVDRRSFSDYPRQLAIEVSADGTTFESAWEGGVLPELASRVARGERPAAIQLTVRPLPFRAVRLRQTGRTPRHWFWAIDELQLRGR